MKDLSETPPDAVLLSALSEGVDEGALSRGVHLSAGLIAQAMGLQGRDQTSGGTTT